MIAQNITTSICAHCGRPVLNPVLHGGYAYHYECTQSPYVKEIKIPILPTKVPPKE
jgi:hypothetical protein